MEVFVHDPETLEYFFVEMDAASGIPALPQMVLEGQEVPGPTELSGRLKARATAIIGFGPPLLDRETERRRRYLLTDLLDDLRGWRSPGELMACGARLFEELADYHLRAGGHWSAKGKAIPVALHWADAVVHAILRSIRQPVPTERDRPCRKVGGAALAAERRSPL